MLAPIMACVVRVTFTYTKLPLVLQAMNLFLTISTRGWGGMEAYVLGLARGLQARGHGVVVACPRGSHVETRMRQVGIETLTLPGNPVSALVALHTALRQRRPQLIHANGGREYWPVILSATTGRMVSRWPVTGRTRVVLTRHLLQPLKSVTRALINARADRVIVPSVATRNAMSASGIDERKLRLVYHGIDVAPYTAPRDESGFRETWRLDRAVPLVGIVSNLHGPYGKGHLTLLRSIALVRAHHPSCRWVIAGDGPLRSTLVTLATELGIMDRVIFTGWLDPNQVPELLRCLSLFVLLPQDQEVLSYAVLEAMAAAVPVITSPVGGAKELVVEDVTGYLVGPDDHVALARYTTRLLASPTLRRELGEAGRRRATEAFGITRCLDGTEAVYAELAELTSQSP